VFDVSAYRKDLPIYRGDLTQFRDPRDTTRVFTVNTVTLYRNTQAQGIDASLDWRNGWLSASGVYSLVHTMTQPIAGYIFPGPFTTHDVAVVASLRVPDDWKRGSLLGAIGRDADITVLGRPSALEVRHRIGYLPEEKGLYKKMKAWAVIAYFATLKGMAKKAAKLRAYELLERYGLKDFANKPTDALSKGMQQKVQVLASIAHDPEFVILDEPFSGLDAQTRETMQGELLKIWDERKKTAIFVTHQIDEAVYLADRVIAFSARPARIVAEWKIPFERPRPLELKQSPEVHDLEREIWHVVRTEGAKA